MRILIVGKLNDIIELSGAASIMIRSSSQAVDVDALSIEKIMRAPPEVETLGYDRIFYPDNIERIETPRQLAETVTDLMNKNDYIYIIAPSTKLFKESLAYAGQKLQIPIIPDVSQIEAGSGRHIFMRTIMAGRVRSYETPLNKAIILIGLGRFRGGRFSEKKTSFVPIKISVDTSFRIIEKREKARGAVRLEEADIIISVGRGFRSKDDLKLAFELADLLRGQVGCSRPIAADLKWLPEEHWIGLSGKKVRPKLYIALGISGQPQHIAGILESRVIVAVNKDPNAPIFKNADYGIVGDLYEFIPKFSEKIKEILGVK
ncbi:MAG: electron transfer flavoprotein subunit alpha/FixB family protein [Desulfurococcales archaeon]|nr:electron transfer flavoprotein subunit alpha/FixB family protein [Desulfurococcales archaeon]